MVARKTVGLAAAMVLVFGGLAAAQQSVCTVAPEPPDRVEATVDAAVKATAKAPLTPAVLKLGWKAPSVDRDHPGNAPTSYVIEAGTDRGLTDVAVGPTSSPDLTFAVPMANGTYYVRVRSANACGTSRPSKDVRVRVENSVEKGRPNPLVILTTVHATREKLGARAYVRVLGQVRNGWQAAPTPFVTVTATFEGTNGELDVVKSAYANGTSRRLKQSHLVTDTVLEPGATGCFLIFAEFPVGRVTGLGIVASADPVDTEPLKGRVELDGPVGRTADEFGDLVVSGRMKNVGDRATRFGEVWTEPRDAAGQVLDCQATSVHGSKLTLDDGLAIRTGLQPDESGDFTHTTEAVHSATRTLRQWVTWDETDAQAPPVVTPKYRTLRKQLISLLEGDPQATSTEEVAQARDALRDEARSIEQRVGAAARQ